MFELGKAGRTRVASILTAITMASACSMSDRAQALSEYDFLGVTGDQWERRLSGGKTEHERRDATQALVYIYLGLDRPGVLTMAPGFAMVLDEDMQQRASRIMPALRDAIGDESAMVRLSAVQAVMQMRWHAASAVPQLRMRLSDPDRDVRKAAWEALGEIDATSRFKEKYLGSGRVKK